LREANSAPDSDLDVLVEFKPSAKVGYVAYFSLRDELSDLVKRPVDLATKRSLRSPLHERILAEVEVLYAE
jgi:predicted nucleotidyltransferase